jgi:hypothetical protein
MPRAYTWVCLKKEVVGSRIQADLRDGDNPLVNALGGIGDAGGRRTHKNSTGIDKEDAKQEIQKEERGKDVPKLVTGLADGVENESRQYGQTGNEEKHRQGPAETK